MLRESLQTLMSCIKIYPIYPIFTPNCNPRKEDANFSPKYRKIPKTPILPVSLPSTFQHWDSNLSLVTSFCFSFLIHVNSNGNMLASRRKEMKEKGIGGLSRLLKRVATAELIKKKRPRDSLNPLPRRSSIYKCFLSLLVSRLEKQPSPWLNGDGAVIDISHRIIAKFSKAHSLAGLNRCEQLFDNDPDAACCICRFQLVFPRCFQSHDALNPCGKGTVPRPALQPTRPTPLQSNASDEKTFAFSVSTVCLSPFNTPDLAIRMCTIECLQRD